MNHELRIMNKKKKSASANGAILCSRQGFTLIEALAYVALLAIILLAVIGLLAAMMTSYRSLKVSRDVAIVAGVVLDRIATEVRSGESIDVLGSNFGIHPGLLRLNTRDAGGNPTTVEFFLADGAVKIKEGGLDKGSLSASSTRVTNLIFRRLTASTSEAVRTEITIEASKSGRVRSENFYLTNVLRGSYEND